MASKYGRHAKKQTNKMKNDTDVTPPLSLKCTLSLPSVQSDAKIHSTQKHWHKNTSTAHYCSLTDSSRYHILTMNNAHRPIADMVVYEFHFDGQILNWVVSPYPYPPWVTVGFIQVQCFSTAQRCVFYENWGFNGFCVSTLQLTAHTCAPPKAHTCCWNGIR